MKINRRSTHVAVAIAVGGLIVAMAGTAREHVAASTRTAGASTIQPSLDLNAERADLKVFATQMGELTKLVDAVDDKPKPTKAEADALARQAEAVKRSLPAFQRAVSNSVNKIKGIGKWNQELDAFVERRTQQRSPARLAVLRANGGARALFEKTGRDPDLNALPQALDAYIREINGRGAIARLIDELTGVPAFARGALSDLVRKVAAEAERAAALLEEFYAWVGVPVR